MFSRKFEVVLSNSSPDFLILWDFPAGLALRYLSRYFTLCHCLQVSEAFDIVLTAVLRRCRTQSFCTQITNCLLKCCGSRWQLVRAFTCTNVHQQFTNGST